MDENVLLSKCHVNTNQELDTFVGIKSIQGDIRICFPLGYRLGNNEEEVRKDIVNLINVLNFFDDKKKRLMPNKTNRPNENANSPIIAYMRIVQQFIQKGYYYEKETNYKTSKTGKVNWSRTIKSQKAYPQGTELFYLDFKVKEQSINKDQLITLIHEYCVYESFNKIGWLYSSSLPRKPKIKFNSKLFLTVLNEKLMKTFNDNHKELLNNMIKVILNKDNNGDSDQLIFGTDRFEYIWEKMIDYVFGIDNKNIFFPKTKWKLENQTIRENRAIEPDTIMITNNRVFVIDAKYYKYGTTALPNHLPPSTSINKQIIYGEYIATKKDFIKGFGKNFEVYNAFLMPFDKNNKFFSTNENFKHIGEATGDWKQSRAAYEHVQGILLDIKYLMYSYTRFNINDIEILSSTIVKGLNKNN
jgi:hypothetical protein